MLPVNDVTTMGHHAAVMAGVHSGDTESSHSSDHLPLLLVPDNGRTEQKARHCSENLVSYKKKLKEMQEHVFIATLTSQYIE
jgi:hypothetical protein